MPSSIKLIATDLDGTLLNDEHVISPRNLHALKQAMARGVQVILATGKSYASAVEQIAQLGLTTPGVYTQGLVLCNHDGTIRHQRTLQPEIARSILEWTDGKGYSVTAYSGTRIMTEVLSPWMDILTAHHEPAPEVVGPLLAMVGTVPLNKILVMGEAERIRVVRQALGAQLNGAATLVQAMDNQVEILPKGESKGGGLKRLLDDLNIDPAQVIAFGDGENDVEMLQLAGIGIAMANGMQAAKDAADYVTLSNNEDGLAVGVEKYVLGK